MEHGSVKEAYTYWGSHARCENLRKCQTTIFYALTEYSTGSELSKSDNIRVLNNT